MELRPYQREDVELIKSKKCLGIFNEQRTGKTPTVCVALKEMGINKYIVVCPNTLLFMWKPAIELWTGITPIVYQRPKDLELWKSSDVPLIVGYERLRGSYKKECPILSYLRNRKVGAVVLDEAHYIRNHSSRTHKACNFLGRRTSVRLAITGTPAYGTPQDIWAVLNWIQPGVLDTYYNFCKTYFTQETVYTRQGTRIEQPTTTYRPGRAVILARITAALSVQRKRKEVMDWVTDLDPTVIKLAPSMLQKKVINNLEKYFEYEDIVTVNLLDTMQKIRQVCADPMLLNLTGVSPKTDTLVSYLKENPDKSVVIFSLSTKYINLLTNIFTKYNIISAHITGDTPVEQRMQYVQDFQEGTLKVLLIQTLCGKEGITLDTADTAIFVDNYPPAGIYEQAKDRLIATNPDRLKPQEMIHIMLEGTYDERLFHLVASNIKETEVLNDYHKYITQRS